MSDRIGLEERLVEDEVGACSGEREGETRACRASSVKATLHERARPAPSLKLIEHRIADRRMLRLIQKWLNAGVVEKGR